MFCSKCGNELSDNSKFCEKCGTEQMIQTDLLPKSESQEKSSESSTINSAEMQSDKEINKESGPLSNILTFIFAIAIIWLMITGVQWLFSALGAPSNQGNGTGTQATDRVDADHMFR